ncbi:MAG: hypothetical protein PHO89_02060 [Methylacidiphilaceae bacterium]|nr:hypothetical protein [Candidatus Methylacidiphilaceae bacterium]
MSLETPQSPKAEVIPLPADLSRAVIIVGGEQHAYADPSDQLFHDYEELRQELGSARDNGFRELCLEIPKDFQPFAEKFLSKAEALYRPVREGNEASGNVEDPSDKAVVGEKVAAEADELWRKTWDEAKREGRILDDAPKEEWGTLFRQAAWVNASQPEEPIRVHCIDVPSQEMRQAIQQGEIFLGVDLPQNCQEELDRYWVLVQSLAKRGALPSHEQREAFGRGLLARLRKEDPSFARDPGDKKQFLHQVEVLCRGDRARDRDGLDDLAVNRAAGPTGVPTQIRTWPMSVPEYSRLWQSSKNEANSYYALVPTPMPTSRFTDSRDRHMATEISQVARAAQKETPVPGILTLNGYAHLAEPGSPLSAYDPEKRQTSLPGELRKHGFADVIPYRFGRDAQRGEQGAPSPDKLFEFKGDLIRERRRQFREQDKKEPAPPKTPAMEKSPSHSSLAPMPVHPETVREFTVRTREIAEAMEARAGKAVTPEAWAEARSRKPSRGLTVGQKLFLSSLRERNIRGNRLDLSQQPIGVLRQAASSCLAEASIRFHELPFARPSPRQSVLAPPNPERKERIAQAIRQLPVLSVDEPQWHAQAAAYQEIRARAEARMNQIPELKHPGEISIGDLVPEERGRPNRVIDGSRQPDRGGR